MKKFIFVLLVFLFSTKIVCLTFSDEYASMSFSSKMFELKKNLLVRQKFCVQDFLQHIA